MGLELILRFWRELLIATLLGLLSLQTYRLNSAQKELESHKLIGKIATQQAEKNLEHLQASIPVMVEQVKTRAWANAKSKYGTCNVAGGIRTDGLLPPFGSGKDAGNPRDDGTQPQRVAVDQAFIDNCALDAGFRDKWVETCRANPQLCEIKEH